MQGGGQEEDVTVMARGGVQDDDHSCIVDRSALLSPVHTRMTWLLVPVESIESRQCRYDCYLFLLSMMFFHPRGFSDA